MRFDVQRLVAGVVDQPAGYPTEMPWMFDENVSVSAGCAEGEAVGEADGDGLGSADGVGAGPGRPPGSKAKPRAPTATTRIAAAAS
jgi:hypothetical protein